MVSKAVELKQVPYPNSIQYARMMKTYIDTKTSLWSLPSGGGGVPGGGSAGIVAMSLTCHPGHVVDHPA